jgi:hypothetical protein
MILNSAPQDQAVLSNVGEIGDFKIKASAKAFSILSSGLYANKIRAIIRELSCNAVDSHTAAGNDQPFEVHLPVSLEPYFSIRDFGTGLNHEQVTQIYTTYFESTKTDSNAYIGALGLGSKSPFSYTDNFTVTAIKDGVKRIYTAFINGDGVPSIALMGEEETTEPTGVEIKFSVNERWDFSKFSDEAANVYRFFKQRPIVTGDSNFRFSDVNYETMDIIPGVHSVNNTDSSRAVMGNIAYPISVPSAESTLGPLAKLLKCGLVMEFDIGELDFQASREGLSYIPQTIEAIKRKLELLNDQLTIHIAEEADKIVNKWERSIFLFKKKHNGLWSSAVVAYAKNTNFELFGDGQWQSVHTLEVPRNTLEACNVQIRAFSSQRHQRGMSNITIDSNYISATQTQTYYWPIRVESDTNFIINDTKVGAFERAKHHFRTKENRPYAERVYVFEPIDRNKPMMVEAVKNLMHNPPASMFFMASELRQKDRVTHTGMGKNVTIMQLEERGGSRYHSSSTDLVWRDAGKLDGFSDKVNHYYIPLSGFASLFSKLPTYVSAHDFVRLLKNSKMGQFSVNVYGVRKGDIDTIKKQKNWINLEDHVLATIDKMDDKIFIAGALNSIDRDAITLYNSQKIVDGIEDAKSPASQFVNQFVGLPSSDGYPYVIKLLSLFSKAPKVKTETLIEKFTKEFAEFNKRYPLVRRFDSRTKEEHVCEYINLVDKVKGV